MHEKENWPKLLKIEPAFLELEQQIASGEIRDYRQIPAEAFALHGWDLIEPERLMKLVLPFLRQQVGRAQQSMSELYGRRLADIYPSAILTEQDWFAVPLLVKDDDPQNRLPGFRSLAASRPAILRPNDVPHGLAAFGSGGSLGKYTPTFVTQADRQRETQAWRRGHDYHGLTAGDRALYTYNTTHKGGQWMQESLWAHGVDVLPRRPEDSAERVLENIHDYGINVLFTVQQPLEALERQGKAAGLNLHSLVMASLENPGFRGLLIPDDEGRTQIEFIFLGGFEIVPYALELADEYLGCTPIATLLGSSEAIPQACSTNPALTPTGLCHYNHLHLLQGPHFIEVVKPDGGAWVTVEKGEQGLLVYTSWARDGTLWIRYAPGDLATWLLDAGECPCGLLSPVIANVHRQDEEERGNLMLTGCAAGS